MFVSYGDPNRCLDRLMLLPLLLQVSTIAVSGSPAAVTARPPVYPGRQGALTVAIPRVEADIDVDGRLDEAPWSQAAMLNAFSQFAPSDGVPAADSTEVLVWYSRSAIYFGIRAFESHGPPHATLADRDRIFSDDNVQILLGTFHDGRQAMLFAVNPLGVQADGVIIEGSGRGSSLNNNGIGVSTGGRDAPDLSPDYPYQSRGRVTDWGYEVEVRIPFKSLRYQPGKEQSWGLNIVRQVKHSGFEDSWAPARRANASFLGQSGTLSGLHDLHRGLVMDLNPELTHKISGAPGAGGYDYDVGNPELGGNLRWGITNNLTLNGTVKPDFSQVESDAGQVGFDPRVALFFPEKRPFFLDGSEQFAIPNQLIYTRRIVQPVVAAKLTGKTLGTDIGLLTAVDDHVASATGGDNPVFGILRVQRDVGGQSRVGLALTDRTEPGRGNQVADLDGRILFSGIYSLRFQGALSRTTVQSATTTAPLWGTQFDITGHNLGLSTGINAISEKFQSDAGFIQRSGIASAFVDPRLTIYGRPGSLLQSVVTDAYLNGVWRYDDFVHGRGIQNVRLHFNTSAQLQNGWSTGGGLFVESFGYDPGLYSGYALEVPATGGGLDTIPFTGQPRIRNFEGFLQVNTPTWKHFDGNLFGLRGHDENFFEWASATITYFSAGLNWRPTDRARIGFTYLWQQIDRRTDGSAVSVDTGAPADRRISGVPPDLRPSGESVLQQHVDSLRDDSRTGAPILLAGPGGYTRATDRSTNVFQVDALFSYTPTPGTVFFFGYGSTLNDDGPFHFAQMARTQDGFFAKLSYLFRL